MVDLSNHEPVELKVTNFGPIAEAKVKLRPLTVFIGPSGTGKSYLAVLIYALHRCLNQFDDNFFFHHLLLRLRSESEDKVLLNTITELIISISQDKRQDEIPLNPELIWKLIDSLFNKGELHSQFKDEIARCFGIDNLEALISKKSDKKTAEIIWQTYNSDHSVPTEHQLIISNSDVRFKTTLPGEPDPRVTDPRVTDPMRKEVLAREELPLARIFSPIIARHLRPIIYQTITPFHLPAFYLPADRTGIMHAHRIVVSALIERATMGGLRRPHSTPVLSGVLADFLEQLIALDGRSHHPTHRRSKKKSSVDLGKLIEDSVLDGTVKVKKSETNYPFFTYQPDGWKDKDELPLMRASSMVSELAPLVLYLRHIVKPGNVIIIEEPESHLHPAKQIELTKQLATLVNKGVRVIVTTHSQWVLETLANAIQRSNLPQNQITNKEVALKTDQVGAWLFQPKSQSPMKSVVKEISIDESGLYPSGFDDVANTLHNDWAKISSYVEK